MRINTIDKPPLFFLSNSSCKCKLTEFYLRPSTKIGKKKANHYIAKNLTNQICFIFNIYKYSQASFLFGESQLSLYIRCEPIIIRRTSFHFTTHLPNEHQKSYNGQCLRQKKALLTDLRRSWRTMLCRTIRCLICPVWLRMTASKYDTNKNAKGPEQLFQSCLDNWSGVLMALNNSWLPWSVQDVNIWRNRFTMQRKVRIESRTHVAECFFNFHTVKEGGRTGGLTY